MILRKVHQRVVSLKSMKNREPWTFHYLSSVVIFLTSIVLSPHYVYMGIKSGNEWSPYYNALPLSFFFGILQAGVQVALDDPFAFINEDDIDPRLVRMPRNRTILQSLGLSPS